MVATITLARADAAPRQPGDPQQSQGERQAHSWRDPHMSGIKMRVLHDAFTLNYSNDYFWIFMPRRCNDWVNGNAAPAN